MDGSVPGTSVSPTVTELLKRLRVGDDGAFDRLFPVVYGRLHALAHIQRTRWSGQNSLNATAIVHELYLKLSGKKKPEWQDRAHFLAVAAISAAMVNRGWSMALAWLYRDLKRSVEDAGLHPEMGP